MQPYQEIVRPARWNKPPLPVTHSPQSDNRYKEWQGLVLLMAAGFLSGAGMLMYHNSIAALPDTQTYPVMEQDKEEGPSHKEESKELLSLNEPEKQAPVAVPDPWHWGKWSGGHRALCFDKSSGFCESWLEGGNLVQNLISIELSENSVLFTVQDTSNPWNMVRQTPRQYLLVQDTQNRSLASLYLLNGSHYTFNRNHASHSIVPRLDAGMHTFVDTFSRVK